MKISGQRRKAISPIIATVLIIAATLIAFAAVLGYIFGIFGSAAATPKITEVSSTMPYVSTAGTLTIACGGSALNTVTFSNTGTANDGITSMVLSYGGSSYTSNTLATACTVTAGSSATIDITAAPVSSAGEAFSGYVITAAGTQVPFTGSFS